MTSSGVDGKVFRKKLKKVVLAYSGGLDSSVIVPWLRENYGCEVVCFTADVGQGLQELEGLEQKAKASGACQLVVKDLKEEFVRDFIFPCLRAGAIYERKYLLGTSMARPVIAKAMVDVAKEVGADAVSHGCTGKGNDQVRFELTFFALNPELTVVAPWREWEITGREDAIEYAIKHNVPVPVTKKSIYKSIYSRDRNLWHLSHEGDILEDPAFEPDEDMYQMTVALEGAPDRPEYLKIGIVEGLPVSINGKELSPASLLSELNEIGGKHGIGRVDMVENRLVGMKSRGVYETPGGTILFTAARELESLTLDRETIQIKDSLALKYAELVYAGRWFDPLRESMDAFMKEITKTTTGLVTLKLYKGSVTVTGRFKSEIIEENMSIDNARILDFDEGWDLVRKGISKLINILKGTPCLEFTSQEYIQLYDTIYTMCTQKHPHDYSQLFCDKYTDFFRGYFESEVMYYLKDKQGKFLLIEILERWSSHKKLVKLLATYFIAQPSPAHLSGVALDFFYNMAYQQFKSRAKDAFIALMDEDREGKQIDRDLLKNVASLLFEINMGKTNLYLDDFEIPILEHISSYYSRAAKRWISEDPASYMLVVHQSLENEKSLVSHYLERSCVEKILKVVETELLVKYTFELLEMGPALLNDDKVEELLMMYKLFNLIPDGLELMADMFKKHVSSIAEILMAEDATNKMAYAVKLIEAYDKYGAYVSGIFSNTSCFNKALRESFKVICSKVIHNRSAEEHLTSYCDHILKGRSPKLSDEAISITLDKIITVASHSSAVDYLIECFRKKLALRLLLHRRNNLEYERLLLEKLKWKFGNDSIRKMKVMVSEMSPGNGIQDRFKNYLTENHAAGLGMNFNVNTLNSYCWPDHESPTIVLPAEMEDCVRVYGEFYKTETMSLKKKLTWNHSLGRCHISGKFESGPIELVVETIQAVVLLLFNDAKRLSYENIKTQTQLCDNDLVRCLESLSCKKYRILKKEPDTGSVSEDDCFEFNSEFNDETNRKIWITLPPGDKNKNKNKKVEVSVPDDLRYRIEAAIIRVMKRHKELDYGELVAKSIVELQFTPELTLLKKRLESLLERGYLKRDEQCMKRIIYIPED